MLLTGLPPAPMNPDQLDLFDRHSIRAREIGTFNAASNLARLQALEGRIFIGCDVGGDKFSGKLYIVEGGRLRQHPGFSLEHKSTGGEGYVAGFERAEQVAQELGITVGISYAGPLSGTTPADGPNVDKFLGGLRYRHGNDFARMVRSLGSVQNDAPAGLAESALQLERARPGIRNIIYLINGSGLGGAALIDGTMFATEPGHVEALEPFRRFTDPDSGDTWLREAACGMGRADFTCIEKVAATKAGIEAIWLAMTGEPLDGKAIEGRYLAGDPLAAALYERSSQLAAHAILGMANSFGISLDPAVTAVVGHGGSFRCTDYTKRVGQHLALACDQEPLLMTTYDFSDNACRDGAATFAALAA